MKKILMSLFTIALVGALLTGGTMAYFSDVETSGTNVFQAGTIDIAIDDQNPWTGSFTIPDMKPCEKAYITFEIENVGTNPVVIWKHLEVTATLGGEHPESELFEDPNNDINNIDDYIWYDLSVLVNVSGSNMGDPAGDGWWQTICDQDVTVSHISCKHKLLGMIPVGGTMVVTQSYHMDEDVTNWAQGDIMNFTIEIYAEQQTGNLVLENKTGDNWDIIQHDGMDATLTYKTKDPEFVYTLVAGGLKDNTWYSLIYYADPWPGSNGFLIDTMQSDGTGDINASGSVDLGMDLPVAADNNFPHGAKIWLVPSSDYSGGGQMTAWNPSEYLFDTALMTYDDTL